MLWFPDEAGKRAKRPSTGPYTYTADCSVGCDNTGVYQWIDQMLQGAVWVETPTVRGLLVLPWFGVGQTFYTQSGRFADQARLAFQVFDPQTFAPVTGGQPWSPQPASWWDPALPGISAPDSVDSSGNLLYTATLTWDPTDKRLYVVVTAPNEWSNAFKTVYIYQLP